MAQTTRRRCQGWLALPSLIALLAVALPGSEFAIPVPTRYLKVLGAESQQQRVGAFGPSLQFSARVASQAPPPRSRQVGAKSLIQQFPRQDHFPLLDPRTQRAPSARRTPSPAVKIAFLIALYLTVRAAERSYVTVADSFNPVDKLITTVSASIPIILGVRMLIKSMEEWENHRELKEKLREVKETRRNADRSFLMSRMYRTLDAAPFWMWRRLMRWPVPFMAAFISQEWHLRVAACVGYLLPLLNVLGFGAISISLFPYASGVPSSEPIVNFMQDNLRMRYLYNACCFWFLLVLFLQYAVRGGARKGSPFFLRFHSSLAILISMFLSVPQVIFLAVLTPWASGLVSQTFTYHIMVAIFLFSLALVIWCCWNALSCKTVDVPLVSRPAHMWANRNV